MLKTATSGALLLVNQLGLAVSTLAVVVAAGSLVVRFRRALLRRGRSGDLVATVQASVQPAAASLWLRPSRTTLATRGLPR